MGVNPTRKNVLDRKKLGVYAGGVNYFPFYPINRDIEKIDKILEPFCDNVYSVSIKMIMQLLELVDSEDINDWDQKTFMGFLNMIMKEKPLAQAKMIVRRNRDIAKGTGTLLSPNDRKLGDDFQEELVFTLYKVSGRKGWKGKELWIPNIKLPGNMIYYSGGY